ncbi:hypothetical protein AB0M20_41145 [Actinoplanes sp. NPDC051633]|uniref:hypothetical protein n=1 Tax=Actinoplanes sp. NPDC051633 TaxID=3155670 RepID=UPI003426EF62
MTNPADGRPIWEAGTEPCGRRQPEGTVHCPFCGSRIVPHFLGDLPDPGRIEPYCDNTNCDARAFTVLALQDGGFEAHRRADVRGLEAIDLNPAGDGGLLGFINDPTRAADGVLARMRGAPADSPGRDGTDEDAG